MALTVVAARTRTVARQVVVPRMRAHGMLRPTEIELTEIEPTEAVDDRTDQQSVGGVKKRSGGSHTPVLSAERGRCARQRMSAFFIACRNDSCMTNDGTTPDEADTGSTTSNAVGRRTLLRAAGGVAVGAAVVGKVSAQEAVVVTLSEETAMPGEQVSVSLAIEGEQEPETTVAGYELTIAYDDSLLFVEANGVDLPEPVVNQTEGNLQANTASSQGATVDLTAAEFVFTLDESASSGDVATLAVVDGKLSSADLETVGFTTTDGQVTASDDSGGGDGGNDSGDGGDDGGNDGGDGGDDSGDGGDDGGNDGGDGGDDSGDGGDDGGNDGGDGGNNSGDDGGNGSGDGGNDDGNDGGDDSGSNNGNDGGSNGGDDGGTGGNDGGSDGSNESDGGNDDGEDDSSNDGSNDSGSNGDGDGNNGGDNGDSSADDDESGDDDGTSSNGGDGFGPGFSVGGAVAALGGVGYMLRRRLAGEQDEE